MDQLPKSITSYLEVILKAGVIEEYEERRAAIRDNADVLRAGSIALLDEMERRHLSIDETFCALNASKSLASTHELIRHEARMAGHNTYQYIDAIATPKQVAEYLNNRPHSTAIVTLHLLTNDRLAVIVARNGGRRNGSEGIIGVGNVLYSINYAIGLKDKVSKMLESNADQVLDGKFSFEVAKPLLEGIGSFILSLLLNPDAPNEVIFIPDRLLHFLPLHALPVCNDKYLHDFVRIMSYASSISELLFAGLLLHSHKMGDNVQHKTPQMFAIRDDSSDLIWLEFERNNLDVIRQQLASQGLNIKEKTSLLDLKEDLSDCIWLSWSGHGRSGTKDWKQNWLQIGAHRVSAEVIRNWCLTRRPVVVLAACETAVDGEVNSDWDEYCGLDMAFRVAGARAVVGSMWAVPDAVAAVTNFFLVGWVLSGTVAPDRGLTSLQGMLRTGRWKQFLLRPEQLKTVPEKLRDAVESAQEPLWNLPPEAFASEECWAAFRCHGR